MAEQVIRQRSRGFICINSHPGGCAKNVAQQIAVTKAMRPDGTSGPKRVLVIGASTGYGLASRIAAAWGFGAATVGVFFEKAPSGKRTATAGYYNSAAFHAEASAAGLKAVSINGDAFSNEIKQETIEAARSTLGQADLVIYSLASPRRTDPDTGETHQSALKPIAESYTGKTVDLANGAVGEVTIEPAVADEVDSTVKVMGGDDWQRWIDALLAEGLLAEGARTVAYSYVGPELTWPIYRDGTIGKAKEHVAETARTLDGSLRERLGGGAFVAVNKAVVTQASAAIPVVPLYMSLLFRTMKERGLHEDCIEQMARLCFDHLADGKAPHFDANGWVRLDDREMSPDVQAEVDRLWPAVNTDNLNELSDFVGFRTGFNRLFGFDVEGIDYDQPVEAEFLIPG